MVEVSCFSTTEADAIDTAKPCIDIVCNPACDSLKWIKRQNGTSHLAVSLYDTHHVCTFNIRELKHECRRLQALLVNPADDVLFCY